MPRRTYGQHCGLARALDHVGDRWTLLIVRELLIAPRRYSKIKEALPGIATNLLATRLRTLEQDGLITKEEEGLYSLTAAGLELQDSIHSLVRWGGRWMHDRDDLDLFRPAWLVVALRSLLPHPSDGSIEIRLPDGCVRIDSAGIELASDGTADAVIDDDPDKILAVAAGRYPPSVLKVQGDKQLVADVFGRPT